MRNKKPVYVLGTGLSHDGSVCLLKDGEVAVAIEKERITRKKHDGYNDNHALSYCLEAEGIKLEDVDLIVQCGSSEMYANKSRKIFSEYGDRIIENCNHGVPIVNISHHLAHAYNAIGSAPFDDMAILVLDGYGQSRKYCMDLQGIVKPDVHEDFVHLFFEKDSFYIYKDNTLTPVFKDFSCKADFKVLTMCPISMVHSIGEMYEHAGGYCLGYPAFQNLDLAGKLMGLAPYGKPGVYQHRMFDLKESRTFINYSWQQEFDNPCRDYKDFKKRFQYFADIAQWVQKETENALLYLINERSKLCNTSNLAYTGGVALNAVANSKILSNSSFENIYITPAAGDNGLALGCAYYGWLEVLKKERKPNSGNVYYGKAYTEDAILQAISSYKNLNNLDVKTIVEKFFDSFHKCIIYEKLPDSFFCIQFIIKDCGIYCLEFKEKKISLRTTFSQDATGLITVSGIDFIKWVCSLTSAASITENNGIQIEGSIMQLENCCNPILIKSLMDHLIDLHTTIPVNIQYTREEDVTAVTAKLLAEGNTIGWFQGGSEFGPRALGHRSILADPRRINIQEFINARVKFREDFRPFAPSVLYEDVSDYFLFEGESPYMLMVAQVRPEWKEKIPGVVHKDNSCRLQTVTKAQEPRFYQLLQKFKECTGLGILLNTSFNRRNMPIVETPQDAIAFFYECDLDYLILENYIIKKG